MDIKISGMGFYIERWWEWEKRRNGKRNHLEPHLVHIEMYENKNMIRFLYCTCTINGKLFLNYI